MSISPKIGKYEGDQSAVTLDLDRPLPGLILTGNSGAGKSRGLRVILEQLCGRVPIYVFDPEDELYTLREKFDFVLIGEDGDIELHPDRADKLAKMLLSTQTSAIISLNNLELQDRQKTVANFLHAVMSIPRSQARPAVFALDEADYYVGEGTSRGRKKRGDEDINWSAESSRECIDLCVRGRKRGYTPILATQRPAMIAKAASSQCLIKFIGRQVEDVDIDRAVKALGMRNADRAKITDLKPGEFWAMGPALPVQTRTLLKFADPQTTHPEPGSPQPPTPAPRAELVKLLASLKVDEEEETKPDQPVSSYSGDIDEIKSTWFNSGQTEGYAAGYLAGYKQGVEQGHLQMQEHIRGLIEPPIKLEQKEMEVTFQTVPLPTTEAEVAQFKAVADRKFKEAMTRGVVPLDVARREREEHSASVNENAGVSTTRRHSHSTRNLPSNEVAKVEVSSDLNKVQRQILTAVAPHQAGLSRAEILMRIGLQRGGHTSRAFAALIEHGLVDVEGAYIAISKAGRAQLGKYDPLPEGRALFSEIVNKRVDRICSSILRTAAEGVGSRSAILERIGLQRGGHTSRAFSKLINFGYLVKDGSNVRVHPSLR